MACHAAGFLGAPLSRFSEVDSPLLGTPLAAYQPLAQRLDPKVVNQLVATAATPAAATTTNTTVGTGAKATTPAAATASGVPYVTIDDFSKLDLRVAKVTAAEAVEGSDKLLKLTLDLGGETRTVFSGIRKSYTPESMVGRNVVMIANLAPRKMRFGVSEGMVLCASGEDDRVYLLSADDGVAGGMKIS
jgi:methionyl-tRNA synthetase